MLSRGSTVPSGTRKCFSHNKVPPLLDRSRIEVEETNDDDASRDTSRRAERGGTLSKKARPASFALSQDLLAGALFQRKARVRILRGPVPKRPCTRQVTSDLPRVRSNDVDGRIAANEFEGSLRAQRPDLAVVAIEVIALQIPPSSSRHVKGNLREGLLHSSRVCVPCTVQSDFRFDFPTWYGTWGRRRRPRHRADPGRSHRLRAQPIPCSRSGSSSTMTTPWRRPVQSSRVRPQGGGSGSAAASVG
jgi:hypothetical protein